ncbi:surfeit locus protein 2 [Canna indica]|uniref:Surfeit locus protein 2 n=1 Tax=Canna indica TaxID=4628 RepID=A0AAQ3Q932_9LILI|nr:surfeit locus protein 2 [Canna indica]
MGKRREKMVTEGGEDVQVQIPSTNGELDDRSGLKEKKKNKTKTKNDGSREEGKEKQKEEMEGAFLLGDPTFLDLGNGRLRCVESGHELLPKDREAYGRTKACRLALIDAALARKKPPLNTFQQHPTCKSKLVCQLTGDSVNKSEEHIWKHINGKKFYNKLEQKEMEKYGNSEPVEKETKQSKKKSKSSMVPCSKDQKNNTHGDDSLVKTRESNDDDTEEPDEFWVPPVGSRWDFDDGKDRWDSDEADDGTGLDQIPEEDDPETGKIIKRTKRMSIAIDPSRSVSKKKIKKAPTSE